MAQFEIGTGNRPFRGLTELPFYGRDSGWLRRCQNFRVMPDGYLQARGGFQSIRTSGGSTTNPISAGIYTGLHEHVMADGYVYTATTGGTVFSPNLAQRGYFKIWDVAASTQDNDAVYIGSDGKFSRVVFFIGQGTMGATPPTFAYQYYNGAWTTLTTTSTPTFSSTGEQTLEFAVKSDWTPTAVNGQYVYWVRIVMTKNDGFSTACWHSSTATTSANQKVYCDWSGARQLYVASADGAAATNNGTLSYYGQSSASVIAWNSVSTGLFSGNNPRVRFSSYKNVLYFVNGKEQKRWDNNTLADMGFSAPVDNGTAGAAAAASATGLDGAFAYSATYGFGPVGEWGEGDAIDLSATATTSSPATPTGASKKVTLTLDFSGIPAAAEVIYIYRTTDLTNVVETGSFPRFRIASIYRGSSGSFPATYDDTEPSFQIFPPVELNVLTRTPPTRCKFIATHKNRLFLGSNNQYPGRVWWSEPFEAEAFLTDENFADFTRSTGGQVTGMIEFNDQVAVFTEDQMFGIANVDQDIPSIYVIHPGVGCIAPDSIAVGEGFLVWLGRNGVYLWDGQDLPRRVSDQMIDTFGKMSLTSHGGSRAVIHNKLYDVSLANQDASTSSSNTLGFRYDLVTNSLAKVIAPSAKYWMPLGKAIMPLAHADAGVSHLISGSARTGGTDYGLYVGEYTTQDDGANFSCIAEVHFGPSGLAEYTLNKAFAYYNGTTGDGWDTPTLESVNASLGGIIGSATGTLNNLSPDGASDYSRISGIFAEGTLGSGDVLIRFSVTTNGNGSAGGQQLLSIGLDAEKIPASWGKS